MEVQSAITWNAKRVTPYLEITKPGQCDTVLQELVLLSHSENIFVWLQARELGVVCAPHRFSGFSSFLPDCINLHVRWLETINCGKFCMLVFCVHLQWRRDSTRVSLGWFPAYGWQRRGRSPPAAWPRRMATPGTRGPPCHWRVRPMRGWGWRRAGGWRRCNLEPWRTAGRGSVIHS